MNMKERELKRLLIYEIKERFAKVFVDQGFFCIPLPPDEARSELNIAFPLGRLKRERNGDLDVIEFQFDKRSRPKFVINFGIVPKDGVTVPWGPHFTRDEVGASACLEAYRLYSSIIGERWFKLGFFAPKTEVATKMLVDKAIKLSKEITDWFNTKAVGKHMRKFGLHA